MLFAASSQLAASAGSALYSVRHSSSASASVDAIRVTSGAGVTAGDWVEVMGAAGEQADKDRAAMNNPAAPTTADFVFMP